MIPPCTLGVWSYMYIYMCNRPRCLCALCVEECVSVSASEAPSVGRCPACSLDNHSNSTIKHTRTHAHTPTHPHTHTHYFVHREYRHSVEKQYTCKRLPHRDRWCYNDPKADKGRPLTCGCKNSNVFSLWRTSWNVLPFGRDLNYREQTRLIQPLIPIFSQERHWETGKGWRFERIEKRKCYLKRVTG